MFKIGDHVVYPMQGTGVIESIEEREFLGEKQQYYIIKLLAQNMQIMIPATKIKVSNLRLVSDLTTIEKVLSALGNTNPQVHTIPIPKERHKINLVKIKSGSLQESAEVVWDLTHLHKQKPLNTTEKQMLTNARKLLIDEISIAKKISENEAILLLDGCIH